MTKIPGDCGREGTSTRSRIGRSLLRLQESLQRHAELDGGLESLQAAWQAEWSRREGSIGRRLDRLANRLAVLPERGDAAGLAHAPESATCRLRLVGMTSDADDLDLLLGY